MKQKYSVLMSVYAKEKPEFLRKSMMSMYNQTVPTDDFVLICDGSLNKKLDKVIDDMQQKFGERLRVFRLEENQGLGLALKFGLKKCKNELVARMDSDDVSSKNRMKKELKIFDKMDVDVVGSNIVEYDEKMKTKFGERVVPEEHDDIVKMFKKRNPMNHVSVVFKKSKVLAVGGYKEMPFFEDYYLWARMIDSGYIFHNVQENLVSVRGDTGMVTRRGSLEYVACIRCFERELMAMEMINGLQYMFNLITRCSVALSPVFLRNIVYANILRKESI